MNTSKLVVEATDQHDTRYSEQSQKTYMYDENWLHCIYLFFFCISFILDTCTK